MIEIIAKSKKGFIVDLTSLDLEKLVGTRQGERNFEIGDELEVYEKYRLVYNLVNSEVELSKISDKLLEYAELITSARIASQKLIQE